MSIPDLDKKDKPESEFEEINLDEVNSYFPREGDGRAQERGMIFLNENKKNLLTIAIIILVGTGSYGLGLLSKIEKEREPVRILESTISPSPVSSSPSPSPTVPPKVETSVNSASAASLIPKIQAGTLVGSKSGNKYHFPWCSGAQRIKVENKVWFSSPEEARKAGYTPAANCKGLK